MSEIVDDGATRAWRDGKRGEEGEDAIEGAAIGAAASVARAEQIDEDGVEAVGAGSGIRSRPR